MNSRSQKDRSIPKTAPLLLILLLSTALPLHVSAKNTSPGGTQLETSIEFTDSTVRGRYSYGGEGMVKSENEKPMLQLIEVPRDFKDRLQKQAAERPGRMRQ